MKLFWENPYLQEDNAMQEEVGRSFERGQQATQEYKASFQKNYIFPQLKMKGRCVLYKPVICPFFSMDRIFG